MLRARPLFRNTTRNLTMAKSVCVIGAGPSGLVAAKSLFYDAPKDYFKVTIFDDKHDIGGIWPTSKEDTGRNIHPLMVVNQSKHTVQFGDLAWDKDIPQLPQAWVVGKYLQKYHDKWLKGNAGLDVRLNTKVSKAERVEDGTNKWNVTTISKGIQQTQVFDHIVMAGGIHGSPVVPQSIRDSGIPVIHSSQYRDLSGLLGSRKGKGGKILLIGGQQSVVEVASTVALQLAAAQNSPDESGIPDIERYSVHQVIHKPIWVFPLFTSPEPTAKAAPFVPLDFPMYNRSNRPSPRSDAFGHITPERAKEFHGIFQLTCGTDQSIFDEHLQVPEEGRDIPPLVVMNDFYSDLVRSGAITLSRGKWEKAVGSTVTLDTGEEIKDVVAVIAATGFDATPSLDFLPENDRDQLQISSKDSNLPVALAFHGTHHPDVPNLGFVGFYRGPYWGVMQLQARFLAKYWSADGNMSSVMQRKLQEDTSIQRTLSLRGDAQCTQFPTDYMFLMQDLSEALEIEPYSPAIDRIPSLSHNSLPLDMLIPAHYYGNHADPVARKEARASLEDLVRTSSEALTTTRFVSWAVFRSLLGTWKLERDLISTLPSHPSGHFSGTAKFLIREQTKEGREHSNATGVGGSSSFDEGGLEYLYIEEGDFKTEQGFGFKATRRYVWRYDAKRDRISVWFAKPEEQKKADYLFHEIEFEQPAKRDAGWPAKAGHLCVEDFYDVKYNFEFKAVNLERWKIDYSVKGPKKDYTIHGIYTR